MASAGKEDQPNEEDAVVYHSGPDRDQTELSTRILMALDSIPGYDIENSGTVAFEHIDLDALDELFAPVSGSERNGRVVFSMEGYEITATAAGEITIAETSYSED